MINFLTIIDKLRFNPANGRYLDEDAHQRDCKKRSLYMEKYVRVINKDKESETIKSVDCFPASSIKQIYFNSIEDENHKRVYYIKIVDVVGTICVYAARMEAECYEVFNRFYFWLLDGESNEFAFTIDKNEMNDCFKKCYF